MMQEFVNEVKKMMDKRVSEIHTALPGIITGYNPAKGLASVQPTAMYRKPDGSTMRFPSVSGVPVVFPQVMNQQVTIAYPIKAGDSCLIVFSESALDYWMYGKQTDTVLRFDLTNAICIPGLYGNVNDVMVEACSDDAVIVDVKGTRLKLKEDEVSIEAANIIIKGDVKLEGNIEAEGDIKLTGDLKMEGDASLLGNVTQEGDADLTGSATITGTVTATVDVGTAGVSLSKHLHRINGDMTDKPQREEGVNA